MSQPRRADLKSIISAGVAPTAVAVEEIPPPAPEPAAQAVVAQPETKPRIGRPKAPTTLKERATQVSLYLEPAVHDQLRELAFTERKKIHALVLEGLDLLFKKRGLPSLDHVVKAGKRT